jgi:transcriptional regulator with XRE-family HTH domain
MVKPAERSTSRYAQEAIVLLGQLIRLGRIERRMTAQELAERAGISRALLHRIERGDPGCSIGAVFEAAAVAGVPLFESERGATTMRVRDADARLALMPKAVRRKARVVQDDF